MKRFASHATSLVARRPTQIAVVDEHPVVLQGLQLVFSKRDDVVLLAAVRGLRELEESLSHSMMRPDVVIVDPAARSLGGLRAVERVRHAVPGAGIVLFCTNPSKVFAMRSLELGAGACLNKGMQLDRLVTELLRVPRPRSQVTPTSTLVQSRPLTATQVRVLFLLARGLSVRDIAERLALSVRTVSSHKVCAQRHFGAKTTAALIRAWDASTSTDSTDDRNQRP